MSIRERQEVGLGRGTRSPDESLNLNHLTKPTLVECLLLEKISLHGICRAVGVSIGWLMDFMVAYFEAAPEHLHIQPSLRPAM